MCRTSSAEELELSGEISAESSCSEPLVKGGSMQVPRWSSERLEVEGLAIPRPPFQTRRTVAASFLFLVAMAST